MGKHKDIKIIRILDLLLIPFIPQDLQMCTQKTSHKIPPKKRLPTLNSLNVPRREIKAFILQLNIYFRFCCSFQIEPYQPTKSAACLIYPNNAILASGNYFPDFSLSLILCVILLIFKELKEWNNIGLHDI